MLFQESYSEATWYLDFVEVGRTSVTLLIILNY
jgi:hypothetical protein